MAYGLSKKNSNLIITPNHTAITGGPTVKGVWIPPAPHLIRGDVEQWAKQAGVSTSERIVGYWIEKPGSNIPVDAPPGADEKVILSFHGGIYVFGSAHPSDMTCAIRHQLLKHTTTVSRILNVEYRVSRRGQDGESVHPFPAALVDAVAAYNYLVNTLGFKPENVVVMGDSAGGNLSLALARYLRDQRLVVAAKGADASSSLPDLPSALLLFSPWAEIVVRPNGSATQNRKVDFLDVLRDDFVACTRMFLGRVSFDASASNPYLSPASETCYDAGFKGFPQTYIASGGGETLLDQIRVLKSRMEADLGEGNVRYDEVVDAVHDLWLFGWQEPERTKSLQAIASWLETL